jgi:hypothetical protein
MFSGDSNAEDERWFRPTEPICPQNCPVVAPHPPINLNRLEAVEPTERLAYEQAHGKPLLVIKIVL